MKESATKRGHDNEIRKWTLFGKYAGIRKDTFRANISFNDLENIDSKSGKSIELRENLMKSFLESHEKMPGIRYASALRGDMLCRELKIIVDLKNYASVQNTMKLPDHFIKDDFIKGIDSNIKYFLFYELDKFDFIDGHLEQIKLLKDFLFSNDKDLNWYQYDFMPWYCDNTSIAYMTPENFMSFFNFNECGYAWKESGIKYKGFISDIDSDTIEFKLADIKEKIVSNVIQIKLHINEKGYIFFSFYDGEECVYILSQRGVDENFISNCSFINKEYMILVSRVEIPQDNSKIIETSLPIIHIKNKNIEMIEFDKIYQMDVLEGLRMIPSESIDAGVTSPPYNKLGLLKGKKQKGGDWNGYIEYESFDDNMEESVYQQWQIDILNEIQRVLKPTGSFFYNHKNRRYDKSEYSPYDWVIKSNLNLYQTIIWDRKADVNNSLFFFQPVYELVYWLTKDNKKAPKFFKRNLIEQQSIWRISPKANLPHPAPFPEELVEHCIVATTEPGDVVLDPFMGIGTTAVIAKRLGRKYIGFDISAEYVKLAEENVKLNKIRKKSEL